MIIKKNDAKSGSVRRRAALIAAVVFSGAALMFFLGDRLQDGSLREGLGLGLPAQAAKPLMEPSLPSLDLVPRLSQKTTILLMGVDSNGLNTDPFQGTRSDTMMLVSIDPQENRVGVVSIPRDSRVRIPNHGVDKINAAHAYGGAELAVQAVKEAFGVPCDHFIEVDTGGLKKLFEILGPVEVLVEKEMRYTDHSAKLNVDLKPGLQTLTPEQTEEYVRFRHDARGDIGRIERQQWFVRQAAKKFKEPEIVLKLPQLICLAYQCVRTDLPLQDVMSIAAYAKDFPSERVVTAMLPGEGRMINGGSYWEPDCAAGQVMFEKILGCATARIVRPEETPAAQEITLPEDDLQVASPGLNYDSVKPATVAIKYPRGCEELASALSDNLSRAGLKVKYKWQIPAADCQHELLIQQSVRANDDNTAVIYESLPELRNFPVSLAIESRPVTDFTIIITPGSSLPSICKNQESGNERPDAKASQSGSNSVSMMPAK